MSIKYGNGRKMYQMDIKYTNIFLCKILQNVPKFGFLFENIPSGNPGCVLLLLLLSFDASTFRFFFGGTFFEAFLFREKKVKTETRRDELLRPEAALEVGARVTRYIFVKIRPISAKNRPIVLQAYYFLSYLIPIFGRNIV
jgi:hypothetical protein